MGALHTRDLPKVLTLFGHFLLVFAISCAFQHGSLHMIRHKGKRKKTLLGTGTVKSIEKRDGQRKNTNNNNQLLELSISVVSCEEKSIFHIAFDK